MREIIHQSDYHLNNFHIERRGDTIEINVTYPPRSLGIRAIDSDKVTYVIVDQESVRASGGIRVHFDYTRDGFVIEQQTNWEGVAPEEEYVPKYVEVAFAHAFHPNSTGLEE